MISASIILFFVCVAQNISFSVVSRSRNRDNLTYHTVAAVGSNGIYFFTLKWMVDHDMAIHFIIPYVSGTVIGSLIGAKFSMFIERLIGATADGHLTKQTKPIS